MDTHTTISDPPNGGQEIETRTLTIDDRCDKCGPSTRAYVRVLFRIDGEERPLDFCGSCYVRREPLLASLIKSGIALLIDERAFIGSD